MPKKTIYAKATVIEAGLEQLKESGWEGITPKLVAKKLGASTQPIYSHFATMDEFRAAILVRAWEMLVEYVSKSYTGDAWVDQGIGYILFARDHGRLFNCMHYGKPENVRKHRQEFWGIVSKKLKGYPAFGGLSAEHVGWIRHIRALLTHGIAVTISSGFGPIWEDEEVVRQMIPLCSEIILDGLSNKKDEITEVTSKIPSDARERLFGMLAKMVNNKKI